MYTSETKADTKKIQKLLETMKMKIIQKKKKKLEWGNQNGMQDRRNQLVNQKKNEIYVFMM